MTHFNEVLVFLHCLSVESLETDNSSSVAVFPILAVGCDPGNPYFTGLIVLFPTAGIHNKSALPMSVGERKTNRG